MKNITNKQKAIVGVLIALVLTVGVMGVVKTFDKGFNNSEQPTTQEQRKLELTLDYKETPKEEYVVNVDGDEIVIKVENVKPEIDTTKIGKTSHEVEVDKETFSLSVVVKDNRTIELKNKKEFTVEAGSISKEEFEQMLLENFDTKVEEDDKLDFSFTYPKEFDLNNKGEYEITVTAKFINNSQNKIDEKINVKIKAKKVEEKKTQDSQEVTDEKKTNTNTNNNSTTSSTSSKPKSTTSQTNTKTTKSQTKPKQTQTKSEPAKKSQPKKNKPSSGSNDSGIEFELKPSIPVPSGVPSGVSLIDSDSEAHLFNYKTNFEGVKITNVIVKFKGTKRVTIGGFDNSGRGFSAVVYPGDRIGFDFGYPDLTDNQISSVIKLGNKFLNAYKLQ